MPGWTTTIESIYTDGIPNSSKSSQAFVTVSPNVALVSVQIIAANPNRKGFMIYNNSGNSCYITLGTTSSSASPSFIVATFANFVWQGPVVYQGPMAAIRNAGSGTIIITELT